MTTPGPPRLAVGPDAAAIVDAAAGRLSAGPETALRVLEIVSDPWASAADLAAVVDADPAIAARVLRLANAPFYGLSRRVGSTSRAVVLLGFATVRALAASAVLADGDRSDGSDLWAHALGAACGAACVAEREGVDVGDAFTAGLLHDIGLLLMRDAGLDVEIAEVCVPGTGDGIEERERERWGASHAEVGAVALERWRFPEWLVSVVLGHHRPPTDPVARAVAAGELLAAAATGPAPGLRESWDALGVRGPFEELARRAGEQTVRLTTRLGAP